MRAWQVVKMPIILFFLAFCLMMLLFLARPHTPMLTPKQTIPLVRTQVLHAHSGVLPLYGSGVVTPRSQVQLAAQVSGQVQTADPNLLSGGRFKRGDVLVKLDAALYRAQLQQAQANLQAVQAKLTYSEKQFKRLQALAKRGTAAQSHFDEAQREYYANQAEYAKQRAQVLQAKLNVQHTTIAAPFDGQVLKASVAAGDYVKTGAPIASVFATDIAEVVVSLTHQQAALIPNLWTRPEQTPAQVSAQYGEHVYQWSGYIARVEPGLDQATRTVDIVVQVPTPLQAGQRADGQADSQAPPLLIGMYVDVQLQGPRLANYFRIPRQALHMLKQQQVVWIAKDNVLHIVPVQLKQVQQQNVVLTSEQLQAGDQLIVDYLPVVTEGLRLRVQAPASGKAV